MQPISSTEDLIYLTLLELLEFVQFLYIVTPSVIVPPLVPISLSLLYIYVTARMRSRYYSLVGTFERRDRVSLFLQKEITSFSADIS